MIEGLKIDVTSEEMKKLLKDRASYHGEKAEEYGNQLKLLEDEPSLDMSMDPRRAMREKVHHHQQKWVFFNFLDAHVIPDEIYRLSETDLYRLELLSRWIG